MRAYEIIMTIIGVMLFAFALCFGMDRDMARRDYEKAVRDGDHERPIIGCLWKYNCEYYTDLLWDE